MTELTPGLKAIAEMAKQSIDAECARAMTTSAKRGSNSAEAMIAELQAMSRLLASMPPMLTEIRVHDHATLESLKRAIPPSPPTPYDPIGIFGVRILVDDEVPAGHVRMVYGKRKTETKRLPKPPSGGMA